MKKMAGSKGIKRIIAALCVIAMLAAVTYTFNRNEEVAYGAEVINDKVTIGGRTYTADDKLNILEIVPDEALAELGYMMGGDSCPIKWEDIMKISDYNTKKAIAQEWMRIVGTIIGNDKTLQIYARVSNWWPIQWQYKWVSYTEFQSSYKTDENSYDNAQFRIVNKSDNSVYQYKDADGNVINTTNMFGYKVFGGYDMCDKIVVTIRKASEVTLEDVENSDLIYISAGAHDSSIKELYVKMAAASSEYSVSDNISKAGQSQDNFDRLGEDLSASVAWKIYMAVAEQKSSIIMDANVTSTYKKDANIDILYTLVYGANRQTFKEQFWQNKTSDMYYSGTKGKVEILNIGTESEKLQISYVNSGGDYQEINWQLGCLAYINEINSGSANQYYNEGTMKPNVWDNSFCYNGDIVMAMGFANSTIYANTNWQNGSSFEHANDIYGNGSNQISISDIMLYILGTYKYERFDGVLNVLEIEPTGAYKYDSLDKQSAAELFQYFGCYVKGLTDSNCNSYVNVISVSANGFIGMTEDIKNNYDLIIISDYNPSEYINTTITKVYTEQGPSVNLTDYINGNKKYSVALSGNDFTDKAYDRVVDYIRAGKPVMLADSIYNGDTTTVDENSNIFNLSYEKLTAVLGSDKLSNLTDESNSSGKVLKYMERPQFTVSESLKYKTDANGIAVTNINKSQLSGVNFTGSVQKASKNYSLQVYVDKDANGFYTETTDDNNELLYSDSNVRLGSSGEFSVTLQEMSDTLRGYLGWKAVLTDSETGMSSEEEGAFVVAYGEDEVRTVKVLQISPGTNETLRLSNSRFLELFDKSRYVTGLELDINILTCEEFEALYEKNPYTSSADDIITRKNESGYDMVVLGFSDIYSNNDISNQYGAVDNIKYYIEKGNSVLMSHDVMSFNSYSDKAVQNSQVKLVSNISTEAWSYNITSALRNIIGMDRYGASAGETSDVTYNQGYSNVFLQQHGRNAAGGYLKLYNGMSQIKSNLTTTTVNQLNKGQITQYPYNIGENLSVSSTHAQYFQLDLESQGETEEDDVVVWYTLGSSNMDYYSMAGQDALNNYYIYSKGNITYSGAGHSDMVQDSELKLFVNTIIRAIGAGNNLPYIEYENTIKIGEGVYEKSVRAGDDTMEVYFTPYDDDMSSKGIFKAGYVFWDINGNEEYDSDDILFKEYLGTSDEHLVNGATYTIDLKDYLREGTTVLTDQQKDKVKEAVKANSFALSVQVVDSNKGIGISKLNIISREYFELD